MEMIKRVTKQIVLVSSLVAASVASAESLILLGEDGSQEKIEFSEIQNLTVVNTDSIASFTVNKKDGAKRENIRLFAIGDLQMAKTVNNSSLTETISVYPNPVAERLRIYGAGELPMVYIMNVNGETVMTSKGSEVFVSSLPEGTYLIKVGGLYAKFLKK